MEIFRERTDRTDGRTRRARDFVYVRSHDARREKRNESPSSEALAAKRRLNAREPYDAAWASAPRVRVRRLSSLSLSLAAGMAASGGGSQFESTRSRR